MQKSNICEAVYIYDLWIDIEPCTRFTNDSDL